MALGSRGQGLQGLGPWHTRNCRVQGLGHSEPPVGVPELLIALPKGSYIVSFGVCYGFLVRGYNILIKKELHGRFWVFIQCSMFEFSPELP